jgi:hypothetical protein
MEKLLDSAWRAWTGALSLMRNPKVWAAVATVTIVITALTWWSIRSYRRSQVRDVLNQHAPFHNPPLGLSLPRIVAAGDGARQVLTAGVRGGVWGATDRTSPSQSLELWLTPQGQKWFSLVNNQVVATFKAGRREVTEVIELEQDFPGRRIRFRYAWQDLHPGVAVLGSAMPEIGREYEGEALFLYEGESWRVMHWTTPDYDAAVSQFKTLIAP